MGAVVQYLHNPSAFNHPPPFFRPCAALTFPVRTLPTTTLLAPSSPPPSRLWYAKQDLESFPPAPALSPFNPRGSRSSMEPSFFFFPGRFWSLAYLILPPLLLPPPAPLPGSPAGSAEPGEAPGVPGAAGPEPDLRRGAEEVRDPPPFQRVGGERAQVGDAVQEVGPGGQAVRDRGPASLEALQKRKENASW